jgi:hypothetical protein
MPAASHRDLARPVERANMTEMSNFHASLPCNASYYSDHDLLKLCQIGDYRFPGSYLQPLFQQGSRRHQSFGEGKFVRARSEAKFT